MSELASTVREARLAADLTQAELARRAGITPSYVSRIEGAAWQRGGPWPSDDVLRALARVLGCSSTRLVELRRAERQEGTEERRPAAWTRRRGGPRYEVTLGHDNVQAAAKQLLERNPPRGSVRVTTQVFEQGATGEGGLEAPYAAALARKLAEDPSAVLYRMCVVGTTNLDVLRATTEQLAGGRDPKTVHNIRTRFCFSPPAMLDVVVGEHEGLIAVPDRRGHPYLRACLVIDDPDFVAALKDWYDDFIWEPEGGYVDVRYDRLDETLEQLRERLAAE